MIDRVYSGGYHNFFRYRDGLGSVDSLFVVGVGRSGTSLLQAMLGTHSQIRFLPETGFIRRYVLDAAHARDDAAAMKQRLQSDDRIGRLQVDVEALVDASSSSDVEVPQEGMRPWPLSVRVYEALLRNSGMAAAWVGDKDPRLIEQADLLGELWPGGRLIHIYRDPRDVLASKKKAFWSSGQGLIRQLIASSVQFRLGIIHAATLGPDRLHLLRYESLLAAPVDELTRLCEWLSLPFEPGMLAFCDTARTLVADDEMSWKAETLGPLLSDNVQKWLGTLSPFEIALTESACRQAMRLGFYTRQRQALSPAVLAGYALGTTIDLVGIGYARVIRRRNRILSLRVQAA